MSIAEPRHILDNPALATLTGPHAHVAERRGRVLRHPVDVSLAGAAGSPGRGRLDGSRSSPADAGARRPP